MLLLTLYSVDTYHQVQYVCHLFQLPLNKTTTNIMTIAMITPPATPSLSKLRNVDEVPWCCDVVLICVAARYIVCDADAL